jgi:hypothetical protein
MDVMKLRSDGRMTHAPSKIFIARIIVSLQLSTYRKRSLIFIENFKPNEL